MRDFQSNQVDVCVHCPRNLLRGVPVVVDVFEDFIGIKKDLCCNDVCLVLRLRCHIEFDYDLWTTEDGKCMVRVKITGEVTEVDREVMKALRAEEKRIRRALRSNEGTVKDGIAHQTRTFSLSAVSENELEKSDWLVDPTSDFANIEARLFVESAMEMLSPLEQEIFSSCLLGEMPIRQFAERNGMRKSTAWDMANSIRKKLQEIF